MAVQIVSFYEGLHQAILWLDLTSDGLICLLIKPSSRLCSSLPHLLDSGALHSDDGGAPHPPPNEPSEAWADKEVAVMDEALLAPGTSGVSHASV